MVAGSDRPQRGDEGDAATLGSSYLLAREAEELEAAERSSCMVRHVHVELAELYAETRNRLETGTIGRVE